MKSIHVLIDSNNGIYIPALFCELLHHDRDGEGWVGACEFDLEAISDPENTHYWDAWESVLNTCHFILDGVKWTLYHDGDLFAVALDSMSDDEKLEFFGEL